MWELHAQRTSWNSSFFESWCLPLPWTNQLVHSLGKSYGKPNSGKFFSGFALLVAQISLIFTKKQVWKSETPVKAGFQEMQHECPLNIPSRKDSEWYSAIHKVIMRQYYYQLLVQTKSCPCNLRLVCSYPLTEIIVLENKVLAPHCGFNLSVFYYFHRLFLILKQSMFFFLPYLHASLTIHTCLWKHIKNNIFSAPY